MGGHSARGANLDSFCNTYQYIYIHIIILFVYTLEWDGLGIFHKIRRLF